MSEKSDPTATDTGSVADEAMKLMESLGMWAATAGHSTDTPPKESMRDDSPVQPDAGASGAPSGSGCDCGPTAHSPAVCKVCPVCRVGAFLEGLSPEVMERFADIIAMVAGSLQAVAQQRRAQADAATPAPDAATAATRPSTRKVRVTGDAPDGEEAVDPSGSAE
ncbi:hypothetical protein [Calidifontibacter indicus]|uniref:hypothetical protein n=1 Tax=Calidifontibacter indicus TaxID=419650 RepID=UPI003D71BF72